MTRAERKSNEAEWRKTLTQAEMPWENWRKERRHKWLTKPDPHIPWWVTLAKCVGLAVLCGMVWGFAWWMPLYATVRLFWGHETATWVSGLMAGIGFLQAFFGYLKERYEAGDWEDQ